MTNIIVTLQVEGTHNWPGCNLSDVMYLASLHRHVFHVVAKKHVTHDDRDIEIITLKHQILRYLREKYGEDSCQFGSQSCEMLAKELFHAFSLCYCSVMEDNENGAEIIA